MKKLAKKVTQDWIVKNGACKFDLRKKDILLYDGGLFSIEKEKVMLSRMIGSKKLPHGRSQSLIARNLPAFKPE